MNAHIECIVPPALETTEALASGEEVETELKEATFRISELEEALAAAQRREYRLIGRLEQRDADLAEALQANARQARPPGDQGNVDVGNTAQVATGGRLLEDQPPGGEAEQFGLDLPQDESDDDACKAH